MRGSVARDSAPCQTDGVVVTIANVLATIGGLAAIAGLVWIAWRGDPDRHREDDARAFFDRHGRWPDEPEGS